MTQYKNVREKKTIYNFCFFILYIYKFFYLILLFYTSGCCSCCILKIRARFQLKVFLLYFSVTLQLLFLLFHSHIQNSHIRVRTHIQLKKRIFKIYNLKIKARFAIDFVFLYIISFLNEINIFLLLFDFFFLLKLEYTQLEIKYYVHTETIACAPLFSM